MTSSRPDLQLAPSLTHASRGQLALKVVARPSYYEGELCSADELAGNPAHSLHKLCALPFEVTPAAVSLVIHSLSKRGEVVLDPFCGSGIVGLEARLSEREFFMSDSDPVALTVASAKLYPCDLTEVALWLQMSPLNVPASFDGYEERFSSFYEQNTFRELSALRRTLSSKNDRLTFFLRALALGLLHGRGAGCFSAYSPSERAITPEQQAELNFSRNQIPDYRAVAPRLLRKSAVVLQDGLPSSLMQPGRSPVARIAQSDARDLRQVRTGAVDLIVTNPPIPRHRITADGAWLKRWFLGTKQAVPAAAAYWNPLSWDLRMNEFLVEAARVVRPAGRLAVFCDQRFSDFSDMSGTKQRFLRLVEEELGYYWESECFLSIPEQKLSITGKTRSEKSYRFRSHPEGVLVLRRK